MMLGSTRHERSRLIAYYRELGGAMALFMLVQIGSSWLQRQGIDEPVLRGAVILAPVVPLFLAAWAILRALHRMDEMMRQRLTALLAGVMGATALTTIVWSYLEGLGVPALPSSAVWPLMGGYWLVLGLIQTLREGGGCR